MKRRLFNVIAGLSLALLLINATLWIRGFWISDTSLVQHWQRRGLAVNLRTFFYTTDCNQLEITFYRQFNKLSDEESSGWDRHPPSFLQFAHGTNPTPRFCLWSNPSWGTHAWERLGFVYEYLTPHNTYNRAGIFERSVSAPFWFILLLNAAIPVLWLMHWHSDRLSRARGLHCLCFKCGYDLRATPDRCPECGTILGKAK